MKNFLQLSIITCSLGMATAAHAWTFTTSAQWGSWTAGGYTVYNNIWSGQGNQTLNVNSGSNWQVVSSNMNGGGVKAYANSTKFINKSTLSGSCSTSFNATCGASAYDMSYDIWSSGNQDEIMLWENWGGSVGPIGSLKYSNVITGGSTWNVYQGTTDHNVVSFLRTSKTNSGSNDVMAIMKWCAGKGLLRSQSLYEVQFGFEITSTSGTNTSTCNSYSVSSS